MLFGIFLDFGLPTKVNSFATLESLLVYIQSKNPLDKSFEREKAIECMFDPITSTIIAELEDGEKNSLYLAEKSSISEHDVHERLSYLVDFGFINETQIDGKSIFSADVEKLSHVIENDENFGAAIEGLEKMDSFLN